MKFNVRKQLDLIAGGRKRVQTKNTVRTRAVLSSQCEANSPMKKEAKLNVSKSVKNANLGQVHSVSEEHKPPARINSFLYAQVRNLCFQYLGNGIENFKQLQGYWFTS